MTLYLAIHLLNAVLSLLSRCELDKTHLLALSRMISEDGAGLNVTKTLQEAMPVGILPSQNIALMAKCSTADSSFNTRDQGRQDSENVYESVCGCTPYNQRHIIGTLLLLKVCKLTRWKAPRLVSDKALGIYRYRVLCRVRHDAETCDHWIVFNSFTCWPVG